MSSVRKGNKTLERRGRWEDFVGITTGTQDSAFPGYTRQAFISSEIKAKGEKTEKIAKVLCLYGVRQDAKERSLVSSPYFFDSLSEFFCSILKRLS